jgi:transposase
MKNNFYLGGDASKGYADFTILDENKNTVEDNFQLDDTFDGHHQLFKILRRFFEQHPQAQLFAALESTGGYENNWYECLRKYQSQFNIHVSRLNPFGVNHNSKATLERNITDKQSASNIADYLISHPKKVIYDKIDYFGPQRKLWMFIKMLTKQKTQLCNQLQAWLYTANPEIVKYCKDGFRFWILKMLQNYPTAKKLAKARVESLSKVPFITKEKAIKLIEDAKISVASDNDELTAGLIISLAGQILSLEKQINVQNKVLSENCNLPEIDILTTFNGIGTYSAVGLMIEIVDVTRFASSKKMASFFGLHPVYKQSGDKTWAYRMSKQGRKQPRNLLYNVARMAIIHNSLIKDLYAKFLARGMNKSAAIGALMHKITRIIFGMLKNKTAFDPQIDKNNSQKHNYIQKSKGPDQKRRYLELTTNAPISRRQYKKRKEQNSSQDEQLSSYAGSSSGSLPIVSLET